MRIELSTIINIIAITILILNAIREKHATTYSDAWDAAAAISIFALIVNIVWEARLYCFPGY